MNLNNIEPIFASKVQSLIKKAQGLGLNVDVFEAFRPMERQAELYAQGRTTKGKIVTNAKPGQSLHNYGLAVDIVFKDHNGKWSWANSYPWGIVGNIGKTLGLQWGGSWAKFPDLPHFEVKCPTSNYDLWLADLYNAFNAGGLKAVWDKINEGTKLG